MISVIIMVCVLTYIFNIRLYCAMTEDKIVNLNCTIFVHYVKK